MFALISGTSTLIPKSFGPISTSEPTSPWVPTGPRGPTGACGPYAFSSAEGVISKLPTINAMNAWIMLVAIAGIGVFIGELFYELDPSLGENSAARAKDDTH